MRIFGIEIRKVHKEECTTSSSNLSLMTALRGGNNNALSVSSVYRSLDLISSQIALLPIVVNSSEKKGDKNEITELFDNHYLGKFNLLKLLINNVLFQGNGYLYIQRDKNFKPIKLIYLKPSEVDVKLDSDYNLWYNLKGIKGLQKTESCNVLHFKMFSQDGIKGVSLLNFAQRSFNLANNVENTANEIFEKGGTLKGVIKVNGNLSEKQREEIHNSWNGSYLNNGLCVISGNMDYQNIQSTATESQLFENRQLSVKDVTKFFGIHPQLLGEDGNNDLETLLNVFTQFTLQPYITMIEEELNRKLLKPSERMIYTINLDEKFLLKSNKSTQASYYSSMLSNGVLNINEVRKELGYNEIDGGDKHIIAYTDIQQNTINNENRETN